MTKDGVSTGRSDAEGGWRQKAATNLRRRSRGAGLEAVGLREVAVLLPQPEQVLQARVKRSCATRKRLHMRARERGSTCL